MLRLNCDVFYDIILQVLFDGGIFMNKKTAMRMIVCSDVHCKTDDTTEPERFMKGVRDAYCYADSTDYPHIDAIFTVGDFANRGTLEQMKIYKNCLDASLRTETVSILTMASHEYMHDGYEGALARFDNIFSQSPDTHTVVNGFHCIAVTTDGGCSIGEKKQAWLSAELKKAAADDCKKPIFVFQHPHISDTVYGSINWGEDDIYAILMDYPQVIDFSGHSHAPINDPRSVHQKHFTCFGTGSLSYFELDEFDYVHGTIPPEKEKCAQFLIVEAYDDGSVRVLPYDVLSGQFFNGGAFIEKPFAPESFVYTDRRYLNAEKPFFDECASLTADVTENSATVEFDAAKSESERINAYKIVLKCAENGMILRQVRMTSRYYLYDMPKAYSFTFENLCKGKYLVEITAEGFWRNSSDKITKSFEVR